MRNRSILPSVLVATLVLAAACSGGGADRPATLAAATTIDASGGVFAIGSGMLAGVKVEVPPGAVTKPVAIRAATAFGSAHPGFRPIGRAVLLEADAAFRLPVAVTIPFVAAASLANEMVVLQRDAAGRIVELEPAAVDPAGLLTFQTRSLATCWVGERLFLGVATEEFLPLEDGNTWTFDDGTVAAITWSFAEPNFQGMPIYRLQIDGPERSLGLYLDRHWTGTTNLFGTFAAAGSGFQSLHAPSRLLPARCTIGQTMTAAFVEAVYEPFGATEPTNAALVAVHQLPTLPGPIRTSLGEFTDTLRIDVTFARWTAAGEPAPATRLGLTFARYVGLVAIEGDLGSGGLAGGMVGGVPLGQ